MRQQAAEQVNLVSHQTTRRNISHLRLVLQLPINLLLIARPSWKCATLPAPVVLLVTITLNSWPCCTGSNKSNWIGPLFWTATVLRMKINRLFLAQLCGFQRLSKYWLLPPDPGTCHHSMRFSIRSLSTTKRSKGTEIVYSTPSFSRHCTIASLKKALSMRTSSRADGRRSRTDLIQVVTNSTAPLESCTLPLRCNTSSTWPVCATVQNNG